MQRFTNFILFLALVSISLTACGEQSPAAPPTADHLVEFDEQGIAVLRGQVSRLSTMEKQNGQSLNIDIPVQMDGMDVYVSVPFHLRNETLLASTTTKQMDLLEYLSFNKGSSAFNAFPDRALVDVSFRKTGDGFVAIAIQETTPSFSLFKRTAEIEPLFFSDLFNPGTLQGRIIQSLKDGDGMIQWTVAIPIQMQGVEAAVLVPIDVAPDAEVVTTSGNILMLDQVSGDVQIEFTRGKDAVTAHQVTILAKP
jgi:predicted small lipoprotein YifL